MAQSTKRDVRREARRYREFLYLLRDHHVDSLDYAALTQEAINGALSLCDPHSRYLPKQSGDMLREEIESAPLGECYMVDESTLCIEVAKFSRGAGDAILNKYREMGRAAMLVLDLRGNSGGLVQEAIETSELFLSRGDLIFTREGRTLSTTRFVARGDGELRGVELVVIIDGETASASEIFVGAVKSHGRAIVVGERSFGKGLILKQCRFNDGALLLVATAQYLTPDSIYIQSQYRGRCINNSTGGIIPNVEIEIGELIDIELVEDIRKNNN